MNDSIKNIEELLHNVAEIHHTVYKITEGEDKDWAMWYAHWLITLSNFPKFLQSEPIESELIYLLVKLDKEYTSGKNDLSWEIYYAEKLVDHYVKKGKCLFCSQVFRLEKDLQEHVKDNHA